MPTTPNTDQLMNDARCIDRCIPDGEKMSVLLSVLYQLQQNGTGTGGGGGTGTVTSFSAGNLSPLFTTSVATATTTPALSFALSTQTANTFFAGPTTGAAAAPTFRAMVNADLGTTLTPQFARLGIGVAADAALALLCTRPSAGVSTEVARFTAAGTDPYITVGEATANNGIGIYFQRSNSRAFFNVSGGSGFSVDNAGTCYATTFNAGGNSGVTGTADATNTLTITGGIITNIA